MLLTIKFLECPHCKKWYSYSELMSYTSHGDSVCWSDGKSDNNTISEYSFLPFSKCEACKKFFWLDSCLQLEDHEIHHFLALKKEGESEEKKTISNENNNDRSKIIKTFLKENQEKYLTGNTDFNLDYPPYNYWEDMGKYFIMDLLELINNSGELKPEHELYARTKLWQHINDLKRSRGGFLRNIELNTIFKFKWHYHLIKRNRASKKQYKNYHTIRIENMQRLAELLQNSDSNDYGDSITLIEILRELGHFNRAKQIIDHLDPSEKHYYSRFIKKSERQLSKKSKKLFRI